MKPADITKPPAVETRPQQQHKLLKGVAFALGAILLSYFVVAYLVMPALWKHYAHHHPAIDETPGITVTGDKHPGDPINVALIGSESDVKRIMLAAKWFPADPLGLRSDLKIAADTVLERPYAEAPVSNLFLWGRKEDLAFEQPVGNDPRQRHHVRFWKSEQLDAQGRPAWMGSATYDKHVGLSHTTGQITHHIAADIDTERDHLFDNLKQTGELIDVDAIDDFHRIREGKNGGGDPWHTDGRLFTGTIQHGQETCTERDEVIVRLITTRPPVSHLAGPGALHTPYLERVRRRGHGGKAGRSGPPLAKKKRWPG